MAEDKVVTLGVGGVLSCLDAADGKVVWRKDPFPKAVPRFFAAMSPIIDRGMVIAHLGGESKGALIAFDLATGAEKWRWTGEGPAYASPVLFTVGGVRQIVTLGAKSVVGVGEADGKLLWSIPFAPARRSYNAVTPIVDGQTVIYAGAGRGTRAVKIEKQGDGFAVKEIWANDEVAPQFSTPVLENGLLFGLTARGNLYSLDAKTGRTAWTDATQHGRGFAAILDAGSVVLALPSDSELIAFEPTTKGFTELVRIKVADTPTYATPVVSGNTIFIKDEDSVTMWTISPE